MQEDTLLETMHLSDDVIDALTSAAQEVGASETWLPARQGILVLLVPRVLRIVHAAVLTLPPAVLSRRTIRQNALRVLAYTRADVRLGALFEMADRSPDALRDILSGDVDQEYEPYRYNLIVLLGVFARHGLINGVTRADRLERVDKAMSRARDIHKDRIHKDRFAEEGESC